MRSATLLSTGTLLAVLLTPPAFGQPPAPLAYIQPVPPAAVQTVQSRLHDAGAYMGAVDGVWGADSSAALQRFQASHQLQATGQLNQATATALGIDPSSLLGIQQASVPPIPPVERLQPASVRAIQQRLRNLGFYTGSVDGIWGQSTLDAVRRFQQNRGLQPDGEPNPATVGAMGLPPETLAYR